MNLLETLLSASGGGVVKEIAGGLGISADDAQAGVKNLAPALVSLTGIAHAMDVRIGPPAGKTRDAD